MSHPVWLQPTTSTLSVTHICRQQFCIPDIAHDLVLRDFLAKTLFFCNNLKKSQLLLLLHDLAAWPVPQRHSWFSQALQNNCLDGPWGTLDLCKEGDLGWNQESHLWSQMWASKFCSTGEDFLFPCFPNLPTGCSPVLCKAWRPEGELTASAQLSRRALSQNGSLTHWIVLKMQLYLISV